MARNEYRQSILKSDVNSLLAMLLIGVCALWAALVIIQTSWHVNPISTVFAKALDRETSL